MFTQFWFDMNKDHWNKIFEPVKGKPNLHFLEIGCFEGRATTWLLENVLTDKTSFITCIDTFEGSWEHKEMNIDSLEDNFLQNIEPYKGKVTVWKGKSQDILPTLVAGQFDFIYIDGSHESVDVLRDGVFAWDLLKKGGIMIFDDYGWGMGLASKHRPYPAITGCLNSWEGLCQYKREKDQIIVYKL